MRFRAWIVAIGLLGCIAVAIAQEALSFQQLTISTTAVGLSTATIRPGNTPVRLCSGTLEGGDVRYRVDGADPTSTTGHLFLVGEPIEISDYDNIARFRVIRAGSVDGTLPITCYR